MKLKHTLAAFAAALALGVSAQAATFDAKTAPFATSSAHAQAAKMQVDAKENAGATIKVARYTAQAPANSQLQATNGYQYGAGKLKAKWLETDQAKKPQFAAATSSPLLDNIDKTSLLSAEAKKPAVIDLGAAKKAGLHVQTAFAANTGTARPLGQTATAKTSTLLQPNGTTLARAADGGRAGLVLGDVTLTV